MNKFAVLCAALAIGLAAGLARAADSDAPTVNSNDYRASETSLIHNNSSASSTNSTSTNTTNTTNTNPASSDRETPERSNEPITQQQSNRYDAPQSGTSHNVSNDVKSTPGDVKEKVKSVTPGAH